MKKQKQGGIRFAKTTKNLLPVIIQWVKLEKWDAKSLTQEELNKRRDEGCLPITKKEKRERN